MISTEISMIKILRRISTPTSPSTNSTADNNKAAFKSISFVIFQLVLIFQQFQLFQPAQENDVLLFSFANPHEQHQQYQPSATCWRAPLPVHRIEKDFEK